MAEELNKSIQTTPAPPEDVRLKRILAVLDKCARRHDFLIEVLHVVQENYGYIPLSMMIFLGKEMKLSPSVIYGVVTFYHFFSLKPKGEHTCVVCTGTACHVKGAKAVLDKIEEEFNVKTGETTADGQLGLQTARCIGCCSLGPVVVLDNEIVAKIGPDEMASLVRAKLKKS